MVENPHLDEENEHKPINASSEAICSCKVQKGTAGAEAVQKFLHVLLYEKAQGDSS